MLTIQTNNDIQLVLSVSGSHSPLDTFYIEIEVNYEKVLIPLEYHGRNGKLGWFAIRMLNPLAINCGIKDFTLYKIDGNTLTSEVVYKGVMEFKNIEIYEDIK